MDQLTISVLIGNGNGTFKPAIFYSVGNSPHLVAIADIDGNGKQDIVSAHYRSGTVSVLLGNGDGTFSGLQFFIMLEAALRELQ